MSLIQAPLPVGPRNVVLLFTLAKTPSLRNKPAFISPSNMLFFTHRNSLSFRYFNDTCKNPK